MYICMYLCVRVCVRICICTCICICTLDSFLGSFLNFCNVAPTRHSSSNTLFTRAHTHGCRCGGCCCCALNARGGCKYAPLCRRCLAFGVCEPACARVAGLHACLLSYVSLSLTHSRWIYIHIVYLCVLSLSLCLSVCLSVCLCCCLSS